MWVAFLGWLIVMVVGSVVSLFWGKRQSLDEAEPSHFLPPIARYLERRRAKKATGQANGEPVSKAETSLSIFTIQTQDDTKEKK